MLKIPSLSLVKLMAAIIFISIGVIASFFCAIVDGIIASEFIVSNQALALFILFYFNWGEAAVLIQCVLGIKTMRVRPDIPFCVRSLFGVGFISLSLYIYISIYKKFRFRHQVLLVCNVKIRSQM